MRQSASFFLSIVLVLALVSAPARAQLPPPLDDDSEVRVSYRALPFGGALPPQLIEETRVSPRIGSTLELSVPLAMRRSYTYAVSDRSGLIERHEEFDARFDFVSITGSFGTGLAGHNPWPGAGIPPSGIKLHRGYVERSNELRFPSWEPLEYSWTWLPAFPGDPPEFPLEWSDAGSSYVPSHYTAWYETNSLLPAQLEGKPRLTVYLFDLDQNTPIAAEQASLVSEPPGLLGARVDPTGAGIVPLPPWPGVVASTEDTGIRVTAPASLPLPEPAWRGPAFAYTKRFAGWAYSEGAANAIASQQGEEVEVRADEEITLLACYRWDARATGRWIPPEGPDVIDLSLDEWLRRYEILSASIDQLTAELRRPDAESRGEMEGILRRAESRLRELLTHPPRQR